MTAVVRNLAVEQGATYVMAFQWCHPGVDDTTPGPPHNLTGFTARMQIRKSRVAPVLLEATSEDGRITFGRDLEGDDLGLASGWIRVEFADEDTAAITVSSAKYDLEVEDASGRVYRLLKGAVSVDPNITHDGA